MKDSCTSTALVALLVLGPGCGRATEPVGDLHAAFGYEVASLDPHLDNSFEASEQVSNIYEPLVDLDRHQRLVPALAESWANPDATTLFRSKVLFIVDRALVFEPRNDLQLRYAEIGRSEGQERALGGGRR